MDIITSTIYFGIGVALVLYPFFHAVYVGRKFEGGYALVAMASVFVGFLLVFVAVFPDKMPLTAQILVLLLTKWKAVLGVILVVLAIMLWHVAKDDGDSNLMGLAALIACLGLVAAFTAAY